LEALAERETYLLDGKELVVIRFTAGAFDFECETDSPTPAPTPAATMRIIRVARTRKNILGFNPKIFFSWVGDSGSVALGV